MKTLEQILNYKPEAFDGRDVARLLDYVPVENYEKFGFSLKEGVDPNSVVTKELTKENILADLKGDLEFGFEKALDKRGISAGCMYDVVKMWMWILGDEELSEDNPAEYAQYGLPFFKKVAVKYGFDNPIGEDRGDEYKYSANADYD